MPVGQQKVFEDLARIVAAHNPNVLVNWVLSRPFVFLLHPDGGARRRPVRPRAAAGSCARARAVKAVLTADYTAAPKNMLSADRGLRGRALTGAQRKCFSTPGWARAC